MVVQAVFVLGSLLGALAIGIDAAIYLFQRQQVSHALLDSVRQQTRTHMQPQRFAAQFKTELEKLGVPQPNGWPHSWYAEQLSPTDEDFLHFRDPLIEQQLPWPYAAINHHYQRQQHSQDNTIGGRDIFSANLLHLRVFYTFQPLNPILRTLLKYAHPLARHPYTQQLLAQGQLPIMIDARIPFSSHPIAWPFDPTLPYYRHRHPNAPNVSQPLPIETASDSTLNTDSNPSKENTSWYFPWRPTPYNPKVEDSSVNQPEQYEQISHPPESCLDPPVPALQSPALLSPP